MPAEYVTSPDGLLLLRPRAPRIQKRGPIHGVVRVIPRDIPPTQGANTVRTTRSAERQASAVALHALEWTVDRIASKLDVTPRQVRRYLAKDRRDEAP